MTKLYHGPEGQGWQIPGQQDRKAARVDVPSSPAELAAWLNSRRVPIEQLAGAITDWVVEGCEEPPQDLLERELAGAVLDRSDVDQVNATRPPFLPRLSAEEIEARRMAMGQCPKCSSVPPSDVGRVLSWIETATIDQLQTVADAIKEHVSDLGKQLEERTVQ